MITPLLEKALIMGWAEFRVHVHAYTAVSKIIVPENHIAIITKLILYPFVDIIDSEPQHRNVEGLDQRSQHQIDFFSDNKVRNTYLWRCQVNQKVSEAPESDLYNVNGEPLIVDTFLKHTQNIYVSIATCWGVNENPGSLYTFLRPSPDGAGEPQTPIGYGDNSSPGPLAPQPTLVQLEDITGYKYIPVPRPESAVGAADWDDFQPRTRVDTNSCLQDPTGNGNPRNYFSCLINMNYVLFNEDGFNRMMKSVAK